MPTLHRLATLRDDVIFFVYLYQMWKYKIDYTRYVALRFYSSKSMPLLSNCIIE
jgi:hypothetical protein